MDAYYLSLGTTELIQAQGLGQGLLRQGLLGKHGSHSIRTFFALGWIEQNELLDLLQLFEQLLDGDSVPGGLRAPVHVLQQRDPEHAIESVDMDPEVGDLAVSAAVDVALRRVPKFPRK